MELEEMEAMGESIMTELGVEPASTEEPLHPASAFLQSQMEVGLTPEQIVGAAAVVRAIAKNKRVMMQIGESDEKQAMIYKDGVWMGHDANHSEPDVDPTFKYGPETFPKPARSLRMLVGRRQRSTGTETLPIIATPSQQPGPQLKKSSEVKQMMTPFTFAAGVGDSPESPQPPSFVDEAEEMRREEEELRQWREERARKKQRETEVAASATGESAASGTNVATEAADTAAPVEVTETVSVAEAVSVAETVSMTEAVESAERKEESMDAEITPPSNRKRNYVIPKKSAASAQSTTGSSTSGDTRTSRKESLQIKKEEPSRRYETKVEVSVPEMVNGQFAKDIKRQWELVHDNQNPAKRPWRWNLDKEERMRWLRAKQVQPEYSMPRARARRIMEGHVMPEVPKYITSKWRENLDQPGYESFYPLAKNSIHDSQMPGRYNEEIRKGCPVGLQGTLAGERRSSKEEQGVHHDRLYGRFRKTVPLFAVRCRLHSSAMCHS